MPNLIVWVVNMKNRRSINIVFAALFTAVIAILSQVAIVTPGVAFTLQTFGVALCGYTLLAKWSVASVLTYIAVGLVGLPVFSCFRGGMQVLFGVGGGFIFGFVALTFACSLAAKTKKIYLTIIFSFVGLLLCHAMGVVQYSLVTSSGVVPSFLLVSLPFVLKDAISLVAAFFVAKYLKRVLEKGRT